MTHDANEESTRNKFYNLVHREFGGNLHSVETALSNHPDRKVSIRTIQSWLVRGEAASRRKCPVWALDVLQAYIKDQPEQVERGRAQAERERPFNHKKGFGPRYADLTDSDGNMMAERSIRRKRELTAKLEEVPLPRFPEAISKELQHLMREVQALSLEHQVIISAIDSADEKTTVLDLKRAIFGQRLYLHSGRLNVLNTEQDIKANRGEFASDDGTLPKTK